MTKILIQKKNFKTTKFELKDHGLFLTVNSLQNKIEEEIPYEEISNKIVRLTKKEPVLIVISLVFVATGILGLINGSYTGFAILILLGLLSLLIYQFGYHKSINIYLNTNKVISIHTNIPNSRSVEEFVDLLKTTIKEYLIKKYATLDRDLPIEGQLNSLVWLKNNNYLSDEEFNRFKEKLLGFKNDNKIGFI